MDVTTRPPERDRIPLMHWIDTVRHLVLLPSVGDFTTQTRLINELQCLAADHR